MEYLHWNETTIADFSDKNIAALYANGYVFTRIARGVMHQTRSVRIDLSKFDLSSENRRILKKTDGLTLTARALPLPDYHWSLGKLAKDFYETKFGPGVMSAIKIKELLKSDEGSDTKSNFNQLLEFHLPQIPKSLGYCITFENKNLLHYSYPFYDLAAVSDETVPKDIGMGMMLRAIIDAKDRGLQYIYLGSLQRPGDIYKLQFAGLEWFVPGEKNQNGTWSNDIEKAKLVLSDAK